MIPIVITSNHSEPDFCPKCGNEEDTKIVCKHCGHEYEEEEGSMWTTVIAILVCIIGIWVIITVTDWLFLSETHSLTDVLGQQWEWLKSIKIK